MSRNVFRAMSGVLALVAATAAVPPGSSAPAVADSIVIGGQPAHVKDSPWVVALSSRDRFGDTRAGQFCGGVVVAPKKVLTAAHCLGRRRSEPTSAMYAIYGSSRAGMPCPGPTGRRYRSRPHGAIRDSTRSRTRGTLRCSLWPMRCPRRA